MYALKVTILHQTSADIYQKGKYNIHGKVQGQRHNIIKELSAQHKFNSYALSCKTIIERLNTV